MSACLFPKHCSVLSQFTWAHCVSTGRVSPCDCCVNGLDVANCRLSDDLLFFPSSSFPRLLRDSASVVCGLLSHGPQDRGAGFAPRLGHGAPHPAAPSPPPHPVLPSSPHLLLPAAAAPAPPGERPEKPDEKERKKVPAQVDRRVFIPSLSFSSTWSRGGASRSSMRSSRSCSS